MKTNGSHPTVEEDFAFQRRSWRVQRVGQIGVLIFVLAGLAGVFGGGGVAREHLNDGKTEFRLEHPRFIRQQAPFDVTIRVPASAVKAGSVALWIDDALFEDFSMENVVPRPHSQRADKGRVVYDFAADGASGATIRFRFEARSVGSKKHRVGLWEGAELEMKQLIYP